MDVLVGLGASEDSGGSEVVVVEVRMKLKLSVSYWSLWYGGFIDMTQSFLQVFNVYAWTELLLIGFQNRSTHAYLQLQ